MKSACYEEARSSQLQGDHVLTTVSVGQEGRKLGGGLANLLPTWIVNKVGRLDMTRHLVGKLPHQGQKMFTGVELLPV